MNGHRRHDNLESDRPLGHQPVAAGLRHQDRGVRGVRLDLLAQAVDVGLQGVGGDPGVVAPDLAEQGVAPDRAVAAAVQELQDRGFLLGQPHLVVVLAVGQRLGAGAEGVGADGEDRVFALRVLAQLRAQAGQQHRELERLGDVVVGAGVEPEDRVGVGLGGGQHDDRRLDPVAAHQAADLAAVDVGQADVEQDRVEVVALGQLQRPAAVFGLDGEELLVQTELLRQRLAQRGIVIDQKDFLARRSGHQAPPVVTL